MPSRKPASSVASPARHAAFATLLEMEHGYAHADDLLRGAGVSALSPQDRNLCTALVMGVLRWQIRLDTLIRTLLARPNAGLDPEIRIALRLGAFQLQYLDRIPAHAAIAESVALAKSAGHRFASGMVNAVLRKVALLPRALPEAGRASVANAKELAEATAHPVWMVERWVASYGLDVAQAICLHGQQQPAIVVRLDTPLLEAELAWEGIALEEGALLAAARRVASGDVTATNAFRSGRVRIQEEGSQLIAELAGHGSRILDCCAAPGGKTLILAERNPQAQITACEIHSARFEALRRRFAAYRFASHIQLLQADAAQLSEKPTYDLVLADVPCSGTGTLGRNPEIRHRLQPADIARHHQRQCVLLSGALRSASGRVLYSTCSVEPEENSAVVAEVLTAFPEWRQVSLSSRVGELLAEGRLTHAGAAFLQTSIAEDGSLLLLPGRLGPEVSTDGFFIAMLERRP
jgi:16S rRNA (cytosine967-C5)-methyltransferase